MILDNFIFNQLTLTESCKYDGFDVVRGDTRDETILKTLIPKHDVIIPLALVGFQCVRSYWSENH